MSLATYSRELKVFSVENGYSIPVVAPVESNNPSQAKITWSGDGKWLTVAPLDRSGTGLLPIFKYFNKQLQPMTYVALPNIVSASFFNWTNRSIAVGNEGGEIFVWDIKDKKIAVKVEYVEKQPVDLIAVNSGDTYVASGSMSSNKLCLHGLKTNKVVNTIQVPKSKQTSSLKFCMCKKNYLGASSIESTVCVWDLNKSDYIFKKYQVHAGACTDISFSPINNDVLASVSLTKTLKIHDIRESRTILDVNIGEPINCVDIILNGDKVALGSTGGSVIIYDLRAAKVLQTFKAHEGPVFSLKTQNLKISKSYTEIEINTPEVVEVHSKTLDISVMDVFSPIARHNLRDASNCLLSQSKAMPSHSTPNLADNNTLSPGQYDDSFLKKFNSPLKIKSHSSFFSPSFNSITERPDMIEEGEENLNIKNSTKNIMPTFAVGNDAGDGDGDHGDNFTYNTHPREAITCSLDVINEIRSSQKAILSEISSVRKELSDFKVDFEKKYEKLMDILVCDIKQEIIGGSSNSVINHSCLRLLLNDLNESILSSEESIKTEFRMNAFRLMHIYNAVKKN